MIYPLLQVVNPNEKPPREEAITHHIVEKLIDKRKYKGKVQYLVKFKNIKVPSWEFVTGLPKDKVKAFKKDQ